MFLKKELTEYNRYQAFAVHMAISLVIFFILLVCITQYWYPGILFDTGNGWKAIGIIAGIDLILGPLLTFIVFNNNKNSLKLDLSIIAIIQVAALIYGCWTIHSSRPVAIAFAHKSFITIYANSHEGPAVKALTKKYKTVELYYDFSEAKGDYFPQIKALKSYSEFAEQVINTKSFYSHKKNKNTLIQVDPLSSKNRYLVIDNDTGAISGFKHVKNISEITY